MTTMKLRLAQARHLQKRAGDTFADLMERALAGRRVADWAILYVTVAAFTAVCGAWLGAMWPDGRGALMTVVLAITLLVILRRADWSWD